MTHRVLGHHAWLDELEQIVRPTGLRADPRAPVAAEWLTTDHRSSDVAVDVEVPDRSPTDDIVDRLRAAREEATGERERGRVDRVARRRHVSGALDREQRAEDLLAQDARSAGEIGRDARAAEPALGRRIVAGRLDPPLARGGARVALDAFLCLALDQRRHVRRELVGLPDSHGRHGAREALEERVGYALVR